MNRTLPMIACGLVIALSGCAVAVPGAEQASNPPQLRGEAGTTSNVWNNPGLFGPVPAERQAAGNQACNSGNWGNAVGYHAHAKRADGSMNPRGGFLCENGSSAQIAAREQRIETAGNRPNRMN